MPAEGAPNAVKGSASPTSRTNEDAREVAQVPNTRPNISIGKPKRVVAG